MKMNQNDCNSGLIMADALDLIIKIGGKKLFYPPFLTCDSTWNEEKLKRVFSIHYHIRLIPGIILKLIT